ncbi:hypothetical protein [Pseudalkalibacillus caeni]|uniref:hypothetical protein n=1 Tax=Exobacillus caeni TaxID=2574798 RepID=UPI0014858022|nr:hypothetical protein [Pseudalkalibacillus caeni]
MTDRYGSLTEEETRELKGLQKELGTIGNLEEFKKCYPRFVILSEKAKLTEEHL